MPNLKNVGTGSGGDGGPDVVITSSGQGGPEIVTSGSYGTGIGGQAVVADRGCTFKSFLGCKPHEFRGTYGAIAALH
ncbi:MAG: hypothetical protein Q8886_02815 [Candidatus Phytoplasma australasiaticum]|nr:hypothetical protein [Candidatus Phytoplasma australasiaticum]